MKAIWNNKVIAEADKDKLIYILRVIGTFRQALSIRSTLNRQASTRCVTGKGWPATIK